MHALPFLPQFPSVIVGRLRYSVLRRTVCAGMLALAVSHASAQQAMRIDTQRGEAAVVVEPYAPNIVRVTLSLLTQAAHDAPGYGISATAAPAGWTEKTGADGDVLRSSDLTVFVAPQGPKTKQTGTAADIARFFNGSTPYVGLTISTAAGKQLLQLNSWQMSVPNYKDGNHDVLADRRDSDPPFYEVGATFTAAPDEHDYGLGQNQEGFLDHRGHVIHCEHDYNAPAGQSVCVPFLVTNKGYGLVWDNPSKTQVSLGYNDANTFKSQVGQRVSFFVIAGDYDAIYRGFRQLTGDTPMLPKSAYGYIQSKQRYTSQAEVLAVANGYRERHLPIDDLVIDWFTYTKMGQMDLDPAVWPDPAAMLKQLHAMNFHVMISVWPRFVPGGRY